MNTYTNILLFYCHQKDNLYQYYLETDSTWRHRLCKFLTTNCRCHLLFRIQIHRRQGCYVLLYLMSAATGPMASDVTPLSALYANSNRKLLEIVTCPPLVSKRGCVAPVSTSGGCWGQHGRDNEDNLTNCCHNTTSNESSVVQCFHFFVGEMVRCPWQILFLFMIVWLTSI